MDRLADYDRMAAVTSDEASFDWTEAREVVTDSYSSFSGELGRLVTRFFDESWIDAPVRPGKRGGAFCAPTVPSLHPYLLLNWTDRRRDVLTLAHELGHGVHFALAADQGIFHQGTGLTLAETASVFGEEVTLGRLLESAETPESRLSLLAESIEDTIATVFRQAAMNRFEDLVHTARREDGELSVERFGELWAESQAELLGDAVDITDGYRSWWSYVPHFISTPGYVYAYAYGQLLALSVYERYEQEGESFVPRLPQPAARRRLQAARGAGTDRGAGPDRPRVLGPRARPRGASAGSRRAGGRRSARRLDLSARPAAPARRSASPRPPAGRTRA